MERIQKDETTTVVGGMVGVIGALVGVIALAALLTGCATTQTIESTTLAQTESPLRAAEELGADQVPAAALHTAYARDQIKVAKKYADEGDQRRANLMMKRAQLDAELAVLLAKSATASAEANQVLLETYPNTTN